jgi:hypothetical protein
MSPCENIGTDSLSEARRMACTANSGVMSNQSPAARKRAGQSIDPETADAQTLDPYGIDPDLPDEYWQLGREYFACDPNSDVWLHFDDLPDAAREALWRKHRSKLAFPAGLT